MTNPFALYRLPLLFALLLGLAACGGDGDGDDDNRLLITRSNAGEVAESAVGSLDGVTTLLDTSTALKPAASRPSIAEITQWILHRAIRGQFVAARSISENCGATSAEGTISGETTEVGNLVDGELSFNDCNLGGSSFVFIIDGQINFGGTIDDTSGAYDVVFDAQITFTFGSEPPVTLAFDAHQIGNEITGDFTLDFSISVSGAPGTGFLMETTDTLIGNANLDEIYDGTIVLSGAGGTRLRLDIIATDLVDIDIDEGSGIFEDYDVVNLDTL